MRWLASGGTWRWHVQHCRHAWDGHCAPCRSKSCIRLLPRWLTHSLLRASARPAGSRAGVRRLRAQQCAGGGTPLAAAASMCCGLRGAASCRWFTPAQVGLVISWLASTCVHSTRASVHQHLCRAWHKAVCCSSCKASQVGMQAHGVWLARRTRHAATEDAASTSCGWGGASSCRRRSASTGIPYHLGCCAAVMHSCLPPHTRSTPMQLAPSVPALHVNHAGVPEVCMHVASVAVATWLMSAGLPHTQDQGKPADQAEEVGPAQVACCRDCPLLPQPA